jgi:hypothetical protein
MGKEKDGIVQVEQDEFNSAFAEIAGSDATGPDNANLNDQGSDDDSGAGAPNSQPETKTDSQPGATKKNEQPSAETEKKTEPEPESIESLKKQLADLQHKERSSSSRVGAFQRKINELEARLGNAQSEVLARIKAGDDKQFREDFPEIAEAMDRRAAAIAQEIEQRTFERLKPIQEAERQRFIQSQYADLESAHPDWRDVARSDDFRNWISAQPAAVQSLVRSESAQETAALLNLYKAVARPSNPDANTNADNLARQNRLKNAAGVSGRSKPAATSAIPDDFESAFKYFTSRS